MTSRMAATSLAALALLFAAAARADVLVLRDGTRLETRGPVRVDGRRVVFTDPQGRLESLPAADVDLGASRRASAAPPPAAASARPGPRSPAPTSTPRLPPVLRLTDADVGHVDPATIPDEPVSPDPAVRVTLYSTSWCGWCKKTRALLASLGVSFTERDVEKDGAARREWLRKSGGGGVPVLDFDGQIVHGYDPDAIRALAARERAKPAATTG